MGIYWITKTFEFKQTEVHTWENEEYAFLWIVKDGILENFGDVDDKYYHSFGYGNEYDSAERFNSCNRGV